MNDTRQDLRRRIRTPLMLSGLLVVFLIAGYFYFTSGRYESTDDAYVQTATVAISTNVAGRVQDIEVHDNQLVHKGDLLFHLDESSLRIAVAEANAQLAAARLKVATLKANYRQRLADLAASKANLKYAQTEYERQHRLAAKGLTTQAQLDQATHALDDARSQLASVEQAINAVVASLAGNPDIDPAQHPEVQQAQAQLDRAKLNLSYATVTAPTDGVVTRVEELQVGNYVQAATPLFALVSTHDIWIQANFKEDQLAHMRPGQTAVVKIDSYPGKTFYGKLVSLSPGTGAQFSVLPPENATGNWVKVVQRLPVRIELEQLDANFPLKAGLSAVVSVDTLYHRHLFGTADNRDQQAGGNKA
jgi:membrane fusion protein (multidrug efflux system)